MRNRLFQKTFAVFSLLVLFLSSCTFSLVNIPGLSPATDTPPFPQGSTPTVQPMAELTFSVALPLPLLPGESLVVSVLDEVTGLGLNPANYTMTAQDAVHYTVSVPFAPGSVVKYRYMRVSSLPILEDDSADRPVRYRLVYVTGPGVVQDVVSGWTDAPFAGPTGRLSGQVVDAATGDLLHNILVAAGGQQTLTDSTGTFVLEGLPVGTHNVVAYALDGTYSTFQQGARVEVDRRTPVNVSLTAAPLVNVIITVNVPANTIPGAPLRLAGNLLQLGNTFADLDGGLSMVASRMPVLSPLPDGRYTITLSLPAGADIRYKYTLGDGFWNAEHHTDGSFVVRQLIIPPGQSTVLIQDSVETWQAGNSAPILFEASVPDGTPVGDIISIQFNPYGWTEPIPMWPMGGNRWAYQLFGPLNMLGSFEYRYCRNDQCGVADDLETSVGRRGRPVATSLTSQDLQDEVLNWAWLGAPPAQLVGAPVTARSAGFWAGVEFQAGYEPAWQPWMGLALQNVQGIGANWAVLTPSWTVGRTNPFVFSPVPGSDPLWADTAETVSRGRAVNLSVAVFPQANLPAEAASWWLGASRDTAWWDNWFARYQAFAVYHADLAAQAGAQALILGGDWLGPALPGGLLSNGTPSGVPADAEARWRSILDEVRRHFGGQVFWALPYTGSAPASPAFLNSLDGVYLLWNAPLGASAAVADMQTEAGRLMDADLMPFLAVLQKPVIVAVAYPSASGAAQAGLPASVLFQPGSTQAAVDLQVQVDIYNALFGAINTRPWISGFVSRGYYPPAALQDASASIHGKPAADLVWYWYPRLLGVTR